MDLNNLIDLNPLWKKDKSDSIPTCKDLFELEKVVEKIKNMSQKELEQLRDKQWQFARGIYSPIDKKAINQMLQFKQF